MKHWVFGHTTSSRIQFFRYFFVGGSSTVVHLSAFFVINSLLGVHYLLANVIAFCFGFTWNHTLTMLWVFKSKRKFSHELLMVLGVAVGGLIWNSLFLSIFVEIMHFHPFAANLVATSIVLFWNFGMRKWVVFR